MIEDEEREADRINSLEENRKQWADSNVDLDERFGPGSFGCHEALHLASFFSRAVEAELCRHATVLRDPHWYKLDTRKNLPAFAGS